MVINARAIYWFGNHHCSITYKDCCGGEKKKWSKWTSIILLVHNQECNFEFTLLLLFHPKCIFFNPKKKLPPCPFSPRASRVKGAATLPRAPRFANACKNQHAFWIDINDRVHPNMPTTTTPINGKLSMDWLIIMMQQGRWHGVYVMMHLYNYYYSSPYAHHLPPFHPLFPSLTISLELPCLVLFHPFDSLTRIPNKMVPGLFTNNDDPLWWSFSSYYNVWYAYLICTLMIPESGKVCSPNG